MSRLDDAWTEFMHVPWPPDIGDTVLGVRIGELDDDVLGTLSSYQALGADFPPSRIAQLGLTLAELVRIIPGLASPQMRAYVTQLADLARACLEDMAQYELWESTSDT